MRPSKRIFSTGIWSLAIIYKATSKMRSFRSELIPRCGRREFSERFKVDRSRDEETSLIDVPAPLGKTYDANDGKDIAAREKKMGRFQLTEIRLYFDGKGKPVGISIRFPKWTREGTRWNVKISLRGINVWRGMHACMHAPGKVISLSMNANVRTGNGRICMRNRSSDGCFSLNIKRKALTVGYYCRLRC